VNVGMIVMELGMRCWRATLYFASFGGRVFAAWDVAVKDRDGRG